MLRVLFAIAGLVALSACGPTASTEPTLDAPATVACNDLAPNMSIPARMRGNDTPSSQLPPLVQSDPPSGFYDLVSGEQFDGAPSWEDERYVTVMVTNSHEGFLFDWAQLAGNNASERTEWSALVIRNPTPAFSFTCGRTGTVPVSFAVNAEGELHLRMPDESGTGLLDLVFVPRASP